jgi:DNA replication licensing factor MCM6
MQQQALRPDSPAGHDDDSDYRNKHDGGDDQQQQQQPQQQPPQPNAEQSPAAGGAARVAPAPVDPRNAAQGHQNEQRVIDAKGIEVQQRFLRFLQTFRREDFADDLGGDGRDDPNSSQQTTGATQGGTGFEYVDQLEVMRDQDRSTMLVNFNHVFVFDPALAHSIRAEYFRFVRYLESAVENLVALHAHDYSVDQRGQRKFHVSLYGLPEVAKLRELVTDKIGSLVAFAGTVTRTSEVRPELLLGHFTCNECGAAVRDVEQQFKYTEPTVCSNPDCTNRKSWELDVAKSKFVDWQRVKCQENAQEIPAGSMPRSMDLIMRNEVGGGGGGGRGTGR